MKIFISLIAAAAAALAASPASASSLVYLKDGNVQLAAPDGSAARPITTGGGWESPSQSDDGTIFAVTKGEEEGYPVRRIHTFDRAGNELRPAVKSGYTHSSTFAGPIRAQASPSGALLAYHYIYQGEPGVAYAPPDKDTEYYDYGSINGYLNPSWFDNTHTVIFAVGLLPNVVVDSPGPGDGSYGPSEGWFTDPNATLGAGSLNRQLTYFVGIRDDGTELRFYRMNGAPPAAPSSTCSFQGTDFANPSWSPDGKQLAYEASDGVHVADVRSIDDCAQITESLVIPGGSDPSWGPADVGSGSGGGGGSGSGDTKAPTVAIGGARKLKLSAFMKGPRFPVSCSEACQVKALFALDKKTGKRLGLGSRAANIVGRGSATLTSGKGSVRVKLTSKARKKLRKVRSLKVTLAAAATDAAGNQGAPRLVKLTVKR
jgi:WD40-like Beta Propeller Repeat